MREEEPDIRILMPRATRTNTVLLVLHGGTAVSHAPVRPTRLAYRRMLPLARTAHRATSHLETAVWVLRNRVRGWNEPDLDPVTDARWALDIIRHTHPRAHVALIGHSMGGRVALRLAGEPTVRWVCALAPWTESTDPVQQLAGRTAWIVHGDRDRITSAESSLTYARRATALSGDKITRHVVAGSGHAMLRHALEWNQHVRRFALECATERISR